MGRTHKQERLQLIVIGKHILIYSKKIILQMLFLFSTCVGYLIYCDL